jgi:hypothetical protein
MKVVNGAASNAVRFKLQKDSFQINTILNKLVEKIADFDNGSNIKEKFSKDHHIPSELLPKFPVEYP